MAVGLRTAMVVNEPINHGATFSALNEDSSALSPISSASLISTGFSSLFPVGVSLVVVDFFLIRESEGSGAGAGAAVYESVEDTERRRRFGVRIRKSDWSTSIASPEASDGTEDSRDTGSEGDEGAIMCCAAY